jgi:hypothetical protein
MAQLYFRVGSNWDEVLRLLEECEKLKKQLLEMDRMKAPGVVAALETQLAASRQKMNEMISDAAKDGAVSDAAKVGDVGDVLEKKTKERLKDTLKKYQDYSAQRLAIEKKYNDDLVYLYAQRDQAEQEGNGEALEQINRSIAQATKNNGKELISLDFNVLKENPEYTLAFENLKNASTETLESLLSQLEGMKTKASEVLNPTELREYTSTINNVIGELTSRNPFEALADTQNELVRANTALAAAAAKLKNAQKTGDTAEIAEAQKEYQKALDDTTKAGNENAKAQKELNRQMGELYSALSGVGSAIGGTTGEIISFIADIGKFVGTSIEGMKTVSLAAAGTIGAIEKASAILVIISTAMRLIQALGSLFKGGDNDKLQKQIDRYNKLISLYDTLIDKQKEYLKTLTGEEAAKQAEITERLIERKQETERKKFEAWFKGVGIGSLMIKEALKGIPIRDLFAEAGITNPYDVSQYLKLDASGWRELQSYVDLWEELPEKIREYGESVIAGEEEMKQFEATVNEMFTGVSYDSFRNGFLDALTDMDSSAEDFADNLEKYLQRAIINAMIAEEFDDRIKDFYELYAEYAKSDEKIDEREYDELKRRWDGISRDAITRRDELKDIFGWDSDTNAGADRADGENENTLKGAYAKASEESIDLLAGQTGAQRIAVENILSLMKRTTTADDTEYLMHLQYLVPIHESINIIRDLQINGWKEVTAIKELSRQVAGNTDEIRHLSGSIAESNGRIAGSSERTADYLQNIEHSGLKVNIPGV